jgi:hypothetical protein
MRIAVAALLLGFLVAGCSGGQIDDASGGPGPATPKTSVVLSRPIGQVVGTRSEALAQCPSASRTCRAVKIRLVAPSSWATVVDRHLSCSPDGGSYKDNHAACRALTTLVDGLRAHRAHVCMCPMLIGPGFTIAGRYQLKDMRLHFTACSLCGAPRRVGAASGVLFPT